MRAHNPYTKEPIGHPRLPDRATWDYGFLVVAVLGALYIFASVWPWWPWTPRLNQSTQAVGFLYFFLGGYGWARSRRHRAIRDSGTAAYLAWVLLPVAAWDTVSALALRDFQPVGVAVHLVGGPLAFLATVWTLRGARREPVLEGRHARALKAR
ncbi:MAG TPA: hypothetical protein VI997_12035 [Candidatus Thermoplasmatota archaeon]|nr:hypothetical protein [Candidatus Thermoplasmatota archaeon]